MIGAEHKPRRNIKGFYGKLERRKQRRNLLMTDIGPLCPGSVLCHRSLTEIGTRVSFSNFHAERVAFHVGYIRQGSVGLWVHVLPSESRSLHVQTWEYPVHGIGLVSGQLGLGYLSFVSSKSADLGYR